MSAVPSRRVNDCAHGRAHTHTHTRTRARAHTHTHTHTHTRTHTRTHILNLSHNRIYNFFSSPPRFFNFSKSSSEVSLTGHSGHSKLQGDHTGLILRAKRSRQLSVTVLRGTAALYSPFSASTGWSIFPGLLSKHLLVFLLLHFLPTEKRSSQDKGLRSGRETALSWRCLGL